MSGPQRKISLTRLVAVFGWLGLIGFGGGPAVLSLIREVVVEREQWLDDDGFVEAVALGQGLPGVIGTNTTTYIGLRLRGWLGAGLAMGSFVLPSFLIILGLTILYTHTRHLPAVDRLFYGLTPAMTGIIAATAVRLSRSTIKSFWYGVLAVLGCLFVVVFRHLVVHTIVAAGLIGIMVDVLRRRQQPARDLVVTPPATATPAESQPETGPASDEKKLHASALPVILWLAASSGVLALLPLLLVFLKIGALTYGGGYVMVPLMEHDVVTRFHWVNSQQFADGVALGQLTPGPIAITATFIGYFAGGVPGAVVATLAIFSPSFIMTGIAGTYLNRFRENRWIQAALDGIAPTVTGLLMAGAIFIGQVAIRSPLGGVIAVAGFILLAVVRLNPLYILLVAAGAGLLLAG